MTLLRHQPRLDQPVQMVGERRGGNPQFFLQVADRQPFITCPNQRPIHL